MWIRNVPSHSAAWAPHLFPRPGRGGVFPPSSTPEGVCVGARPSPTRAWSPYHLPSGTAGDRRIRDERMRAPRSCVQGPAASLHTSLQPYAPSAQVSGSKYPMAATSGARLAQGRVHHSLRAIAIPSRDPSPPPLRGRSAFLVSFTLSLVVVLVFVACGPLLAAQ